MPKERIEMKVERLTDRINKEAVREDPTIKHLCRSIMFPHRDIVKEVNVVGLLWRNDAGNTRVKEWVPIVGGKSIEDLVTAFAFMNNVGGDRVISRCLLVMETTVVVAKAQENGRTPRLTSLSESEW